MAAGCRAMRLVLSWKDTQSIDETLQHITTGIWHLILLIFLTPCQKKWMLLSTIFTRPSTLCNKLPTIWMDHRDLLLIFTHALESWNVLEMIQVAPCKSSGIYNICSGLLAEVFPSSLLVKSPEHRRVRKCKNVSGNIFKHLCVFVLSKYCPFCWPVRCFPLALC